VPHSKHFGRTITERGTENITTAAVLYTHFIAVTQGNTKVAFVPGNVFDNVCDYDAGFSAVNHSTVENIFDKT